MGSRRLQNLLVPVCILLVGMLLLLPRLDDAFLWQDEAETALVARHLLAYGLPLSSDGTNWVQQAPQPYVEFTKDYVWIYHSWLQYALTAVAFAVLGPTTFAARVPFVLVGLVTLCFFHEFIFRWLKDTRVARVATVLLLFCVPFLLLLRQCRYYALAALFTLLTLDAYQRWRSGQRWAVPYLVLSAVLLYHSHYGAFFPTLLAIGLHFVLAYVGRRGQRQEEPKGPLQPPPLRYGDAPQEGRQLLAVFLLIIGLILPWAVFMRVLDRGQAFRLDRFLSHVGQHLLGITGWIFPLLLLLALVKLYLSWFSGRSWMQGPRASLLKGDSARGGLVLGPSQIGFCELLDTVIIVTILSLAASAAFDWAFFRYLTHLIPLLLALLAIVVVSVVERWPVAGYGLLVLLITSNALHLLPYGLPGLRSFDWRDLWPASPAFEALQEAWTMAGRFRSNLWMYAQELSHSYTGPNEGLVTYLAEHAGPGQTALVNYEDLPLMFYTELQVLGGLSGHGIPILAGPGQSIAEDLQPDWVIDRKHGPYREILADIVASGSYERVEIPYPDIRWENRPEPGQHHYLTVQDEDNVVLYRRQGPGPCSPGQGD